jgi:hypothetical protein
VASARMPPRSATGRRAALPAATTLSRMATKRWPPARPPYDHYLPYRNIIGLG